MLKLNNIEVTYLNVIRVLHGVSLTVEDGAIIALLGANGAGKSTTLKAISGLLHVEEGEVTDGSIEWNGVRIDNKNAEQIGKLGIIQALEGRHIFEHLTTEENLMVGAHNRSDRHNIKNDLEMVYDYFPRLKELRKNTAGYLSGGEQQRVALARALIVNPYVMLLDEPLSNLDAKLREQMRFEIKELQKKTKVTIIYVTHDQAEAMAMSDEIIVMNKGEIQQIGRPEEIYENPANKFIANFIGLTNFIPCKISEDRKFLIPKESKDNRIEYTVSERYQEEVTLCIRLEDITLQLFGKGDLNGEVLRATFLGSLVDYLIKVGDINVRVQSKDRKFFTGDEVSLVFDRERILLY